MPGRPTMYGSRMVSIPTTLPPDLLAQLDAEARVRGVSRSALVREALERLLGERAAPRATPGMRVRDVDTLEVRGPVARVVDGGVVVRREDGVEVRMDDGDWEPATP